MIPFALSLFFSGILILASSVGMAAMESKSGSLIPELQATTEDERENEKRQALSETMIRKSEMTAISSLIRVIQKSKGRPEEASLWHRLSELYLRRAKTSRFFELMRTSSPGTLESKNPQAISPLLISAGIPEDEKSKLHMSYSEKVLKKINTDMKSYPRRDEVLLTLGQASVALGQNKQAEMSYKELDSQFPKSPLRPEALVALGDIFYDQQKFDDAAKFYKRASEFKSKKTQAYAIYKMAWAQFNQEQSEEALLSLLSMLEIPTDHQNLRKESLKDLAYFYSTNNSGDEAVAYFSVVLKDQEFGDVILRLTELYGTYSKFQDLTAMVQQFEKLYPTNIKRGHIKLAAMKALEKGRSRPEVAKGLKELTELCQEATTWRAGNQEAVELCDFELPRWGLEVTKKWWDLYQKSVDRNIPQPDLARAIESNFDILQANPASQYKVQFAYAEFSFLTKKYDRARDLYKNAYEQSKDTQITEASLKGLILSNQHTGEKEAELLLLITFLKQFPKSEFIEAAQFRIAFLESESAQWEKSELRLEALLVSPLKDPDLDLRSRELYLQSLSQQKKFKKAILSLDSWKTAFPNKEVVPQQEQKLIGFEISDTLEKAKSQEDKLIAIDGLLKKSALVGAPREKLESERLVLLVELGRWDDLLKVSGKSLGANNDAIYRECQKRSLLAGNFPTALSCTEKLSKPDPEEVSEIAWLAKVRPSPRLRAVDPDEIQIEILQTQLKAGKNSWVFEESKRFVATQKPARIRAKARRIQAQILEQEFLNQSLKTSAARLSLVLALKIEKYDKAREAFRATLKIAEGDVNLQLLALDDLLRLSQAFLDSMNGLELKDATEEEKKAIVAELSPLLGPVAQEKASYEKTKAQTLERYPFLTRKKAPERLQIAPERELPEGLTLAFGDFIKNGDFDRAESALKLLAPFGGDLWTDSYFLYFKEFKGEWMNAYLKLKELSKKYNAPEIAKRLNDYEKPISTNTEQKIVKKLDFKDQTREANL